MGALPRPKLSAACLAAKAGAHEKEGRQSLRVHVRGDRSAARGERP